MLALAEILGLIILNALIHTAFTRCNRTRRGAKSLKRTAQARVAFHYPQHPSPASAFFAPEAAGHVRPAGIDW
jgi:hypothetical protein